VSVYEFLTGENDRRHEIDGCWAKTSPRATGSGGKSRVKYRIGVDFLAIASIAADAVAALETTLPQLNIA
jgi:hypothetical protein